MENIKKVLLIGGGGFIGVNLAKHLSKSYHITIYNRLNDNIIKLQNDIINLNFIQGDIENFDNNILTTNCFDYIIWLAHSSVPASKLSLIQNINYDISPLELFLDKLNSLDCKPEKFIYFSSGGTIYGNTNFNIPISENNSTYPISTYGLVKLLAENIIRQKLSESGISVSILRPSNVYGEFQNLKKPQGIIIHAFNALIKNIKLPIYNGGNVVRDFINDYDLSACVDQLLKTRLSNKFEIFNISSSIPVNILELLNLIEQITNKKLKIELLESRNFDCNYNVLDNSKIKNSINWNIEISLKFGLQNMWEKIYFNEK